MHGSVRRLALPVVALVLAAGPGCSRKFFRERTDCDVEGVITQKNVFPDWAVKNWYVYPHPDARFADQFNPDRPPYPADDPAARLLSPNPQHPTKRTGVGRVEGEGYIRLLQQWDAENRADDAANNPARGAPPGHGYLQPLPQPNQRATRPAAVAPNTPAMPIAPPTPPQTSETGDWVTAKPRVVVGPEPEEQVGPRVIESHAPVVPVAGQEPDAAKVIPAVAQDRQPPTVLPEINAIPDLPLADPKLPQQPEKLPDPKQVNPKPIDPKTQPKAGEFPSVEQLSALGSTDADYLRALESNQQGYLIRLEQAVGLGLINSREFQDRREDLYLAALPVTLSRYNFAAQAFFTEQVVRNFSGSARGDAGRLWTLDTNAGFGKNFATGGLLLVRLANQIVIDLGSNRPDIAVSTIGLSFAQPFLRGGGLAFNLEGLTFNERNMLYAMRSYARFRKLFYVSVAAGGNITNNPYGLQGLAQNLGRGIGGNLTSPVVGYLPLLQQSAVIANQRRNVAFLEQLLRLYDAYAQGGQLAPLQVGQVEVNLLSSRGQLLGQGSSGLNATGGGGGSGIRGFLDSIDAFKLQLGLPLTVGLDLDDLPLRPIREQLARYEGLYADRAKLEAAIRQYNVTDPPQQLRPRALKLLTDSELVKGTGFSKGISARWDAWAKLTEDQIAARVTDLRKERTAILDRRAARQAKGQPEPEAEVRRLAEVGSELDLAGFEQALRAYEAQPWLKVEGAARAILQASTLRAVFNSFSRLALGAWNERTDLIRIQWPKLATLPVGEVDVLSTDLDTAYTAGVQAALSSRLDLMNARGQVVDAYRQIAVTANSLQGVFDVGYDFNTTTPPGDNRPFAFSANRNSQQLRFRAELPLVRRAERNNYRAALIGYQRQRRTLMAFEDNIANDVRSDIRGVRTLRELYRIQQRAVELGYSQVDNAREQQFAPLAAGVVPDAAASAALTQQLLNAQGNLLQAQNTLYTYWVSYTTARMNFYLDLELMQLDDRGVWIDEQAPGAYSPPQPGPAPQRERLPVPKPVGVGE